MEHTLREVVGTRVAQQRQQKGWTQLELSAKAGMHETTVNRVENGHLSLMMEKLADLADALDCSTDWLLGRTEDPGTPRPRGKTRRLQPVAHVG